MEGPLSILFANPAGLILFVLGVSLLEYIFNRSEQQEDIACHSSNLAIPTRIINKCDDDTPLTTSCGMRHRAKLLAGVKRRLDQQF
ncbi:hypothetical protein KR009_010013 [Drosophila setifemur]|nr:hypothetical protein KR009_010013 [Drosophila setifemur]